MYNKYIYIWIHLLHTLLSATAQCLCVLSSSGSNTLLTTFYPRRACIRVCSALIRDKHLLFRYLILYKQYITHVRIYKHITVCVCVCVGVYVSVIVCVCARVCLFVWVSYIIQSGNRYASRPGEIWPSAEAQLIFRGHKVCWVKLNEKLSNKIKYI